MNAQTLYGPLLSETRTRWLVTGAAGFIGSHLVEALLSNGQTVTGLDNFSTGHRSNLEIVRASVSEGAWARFRLVEGDIREPSTCADVCEDVQHVLHQAALGSVPRSIVDPIATHASNATGFLNILVAARDAKVRSFVYAASSSTYGDSADLPKVERVIGRPLSPYAATKYVNEIYSEVFSRCYGFKSIGLRYFNVFGPRQDPEGPYAAVIPRWARAMLMGEECIINGDGETSRDFCYVANAVQANLRAALSSTLANAEIFNVAVGQRTSLNELHDLLSAALISTNAIRRVAPPIYRDFRAGDVRHSLASIDKARSLLGYAPTHDVRAGLLEAADYYVRQFGDTKVLQ